MYYKQLRDQHKPSVVKKAQMLEPTEKANVMEMSDWRLDMENKRANGEALQAWEIAIEERDGGFECHADLDAAA